MSLSAQPDTKTAEISFEEAKEFLRNNDPENLSKLAMRRELMALLPGRIKLKKTIQGPEYKINLIPEDDAADSMVEKGYIQTSISGSVDAEAYNLFEGDQ